MTNDMHTDNLHTFVTTNFLIGEIQIQKLSFNKNTKTNTELILQRYFFFNIEVFLTISV